MRTADRFIAKAWHFPLGIDEQRGFLEWAATSAQANPVLVADNVARYLDERGTPNLTDLPSLAPPWPACWIEYPSTSGRQRRGVLVIDSTDARDLDSHLHALASTAIRQPLRAGDSKWTVTFVLFAEVDGRKVWGPLGMSMLSLDEHGGVIGHAWSVAPLLEISEQARNIVYDRSDTHDLPDLPAPPTYDEACALTNEQAKAMHALAEAREIELIEQLRELDERITDLEDAKHAIYGAVAITGGTDPDENWLTRALAPAYQSVAFLHCKNVVLEQVIPATKVQAKRRRHGKEPLVRYHTLRLDVPRRGTQPSSGGRDRAPKSLHIVAGHFAHYGSCCPTHPPHGRLFGHLEGVYWIAAHARGNEQAGRIHTDFDLRVPA